MEYPSRIFDGFNPAGPECPVCKTKANLPVLLVPIPGTEDDGIVECKQVHVECYELRVKMLTAPKSN